jgi:hypothetical protein
VGVAEKNELQTLAKTVTIDTLNESSVVGFSPIYGLEWPMLAGLHPKS